jgi:hypothetical protein
LASAALGLAACLGLAGGAWAEPALAAAWAEDPIYVFHPAGECESEWIELELWDREHERWRTHPGHPRVKLGTCQVEDAGTLLNELRWRCVGPSEPPPTAGWVTGIDVFDPERMQRCAVDDRVEGGVRGIRLRTPAAGETVTAPGFEVQVDGSVWLDGMEGDEYDVLLAIDRSAATQTHARALLAAQVAAAHAWVDALAPRLGKVRLGIYSFPNMPPLPGTGGQTGARPEQSFSADPAVLHRALDRLLARRASGVQTFISALDHGIRSFASRRRGGGARPQARRVLVLLANAFEGRAFRAKLTQEAVYRAQLARDSRIAVHLFAVGGLSERLGARMRGLLEEHETHFHRVLGAELETPFLNSVALPVVESVSLANTSVGDETHPATTQPDGRFRGSLPVQPGPNRARARARLSDGSMLEHVWSFHFDDSQTRERWLAKERERMQQVRQEKRLELRGADKDGPSEAPR